MAALAAREIQAFLTELGQCFPGKAALYYLGGSALCLLGKIWGQKYAMAVRSWKNNWDSLSAFFDDPDQIRRRYNGLPGLSQHNCRLV
jgi:hypothetical protein